MRKVTVSETIEKESGDKMRQRIFLEEIQKLKVTFKDASDELSNKMADVMSANLAH